MSDIYIFLILLFLIFYFILAKIRLDWAVMLLIAALPSYLIRFKILGIPATLLEAMILISFVVWFFKNYKDILNKIKCRLKIKNWQLEIISYPFGWEIILLLFISYAALAVSEFSNSAMGVWKAYFFEPILLFIVVLNVFGKHTTGANLGQKKQINSLERILWALSLSAFTVSVFAIYQKITGHFIPNELWAAVETRRITSFFGYPNAVGLFLGQLVMVMIGYLIFNFQFLIPKQTTSYKLRVTKIIFLFLTIILSLLAIYFAKSEGALAGIAVGLIIFGILAGRRIRWLTILCSLVVGIGLFTGQPMRDYAAKKITLQDLSGEIRQQQWRETWQMLTSDSGRFLFGSGLANYQQAIQPYHQEGIFFNRDNDPDFRRKIVLFDENYKKKYWQPLEIYLYPHNILLNFWTELGIAGALLFVWIIGKYLVIGIWNLFGYWSLEFGNSERRKNKYLVLGLLGAMIVIIVHGVVDVPYFKNDLAVMFWLLAAIISMLNIGRGARVVE
ncbi:MAG: hypothetical protein CEN91_223 [Candidatus Berkelbacteria bacterium Licking1014_85]|uniref:O-antigen ligase-related domain-containing protein n=1 Tax=Candidatus Berkelbacteria bacterium Licking1014_85 TaxID=2017148 RepID=A0A554LLM6_9BACT|nr:MAG: hypothetical protein CEN91_223 [Candidatus Berkelbacteria bacterium Licking1014_85]